MKAIVLSTLGAMLVLCVTATAQVATGTPQFGSFGGGPFDTLNLGNLNVHFVVPILSKPGRGMPFTYQLVYDSSIWAPVTSSGTTSWQPYNTSGSSTVLSYWGWQGLSNSGTSYVAYQATYESGSCGSAGQYSYEGYSYSNFVYYDKRGAHAFPGEWGEIFNSPGTSYDCPPNVEEGVFTAAASDGSGFTVNATYGFEQISGSYYPWVSGTVVTKRGAVLTPAFAQNYSGQAQQGPFTDWNGNQITVTNGVYTDTLGQTALTVLGTQPSNTTLSYTAPSGATATYTVSYTSYTVKTNFGCTSVTEYSQSNVYLVNEIELPDGTSYTFGYEQTAGGTSGETTGRLTSVTLPTGGEIQYAYPLTSSGNNPINCADGSVAAASGSNPSMTRTVTPSTVTGGTSATGTWNYSRTESSPANLWTTTVTDPNNNQTVINFSEDTATSSTHNFYETQRQIYQGTVPTSPTNCSSTVTTNCLLLTTTTCYNGNYSSCGTSSVSSPISKGDYYAQPAGGTTRLSEITYNATYGLVTDDKEYTYGVAAGTAPGTTDLVRETVTTYASLGNGIVDLPSSVVVKDWTQLTNGNPAVLASSSYSYDQTTPTPSTSTPQHIAITGSRGNLTTLTISTSTSASLTKTFTYFDTGTTNVATDVNGAQTTYNYPNATSTCGNGFPASISEPLSLTRYFTWNCTGAVSTQLEDENGNYVTSSYTDADFWRPASVTDQMSSTTKIKYTGETAVEASLEFNNNESISDSLITVDGFGRAAFTQRKQSPSATDYDTAETDYNDIGQANRSTMLYSTTASPTTSNTSAPATSTTYDALGRALTVTDADGGQVSYTYLQNDVLQVVSGTPKNTQAFEKQLEYDGLGRLTSVCEINLSGNLPNTGTCSQNTTRQGYWTQYTYDAIGHLLTVTQNAQAATGSQQTRAFTYDMVGRMLTESNPETGNSGKNGTIYYTYDSTSTSTCGTTPALGCGDLVQRQDAATNITNYTYDGLHRILTAGNAQISGATLRAFVYDTATGTPPTGWSATTANPKTHMIEATTTNTSGTVQTDEWFAYDKDGRMTDVFEKTPNSSGYYHTTGSYWPTGTLETLTGIPSVPTIYYGTNASAANYLDGEGRVKEVTASSGNSPVTGVTYAAGPSNPIGAITQVVFGSTDSDSFGYDVNTGRMTSYSFSVNGNSDKGTLTWSANGTLSKLAITDSIPGTADSQTCTYGYDDIQRVSGVACGSLWVQNFTYDAFGNISKSVPSGDGGLSFLPTYYSTTVANNNQFVTLPGATPTYDADGRLLTDNLNTYTWDPNWGTMTTVTPSGGSKVTATYDGLGRMVENNAGGLYTQFVYGPTGTKLAKCSAQTLVKALIPLPGGGKAIYNSSGLAYYRHSDWLGSSRVTSTASQTLYSSSAYAPFGEQYATAGTADASFTGQDQDTVGNLYDFPARRQSPSQGRWISPDPAGLSAVSAGSPQSWNRYAYALNNPLALIDATGLSVRHRHGPHAFDCPIDISCVEDPFGSDDDSDDDGDDSGYGYGDNSSCDATCQVQQALLNSLMALLTNSNCAALIGGSSAAGQAAVIEDIAGQLFGNPNQFIQFNPGPVSSVPSDAYATTFPGPISVTLPGDSNPSLMSGVQINIGPNFYNPPSWAALPPGGVAQNQENGILEEFGHATGFLNAPANQSYGYPNATGIMMDNSTNLAPQAVQNSQNVQAACDQGGNVPTTTSDVDETIQ